MITPIQILEVLAGTSRTRNIGNAYYYTIDGEAFTTISSDEEVVFAVTIGVEQKKEKTKED